MVGWLVWSGVGWDDGRREEGGHPQNRLRSPKYGVLGHSEFYWRTQEDCSRANLFHSCKSFCSMLLSAQQRFLFVYGLAANISACFNLCKYKWRKHPVEQTAPATHSSTSA